MMINEKKIMNKETTVGSIYALNETIVCLMHLNVANEHNILP